MGSYARFILEHKHLVKSDENAFQALSSKWGEMSAVEKKVRYFMLFTPVGYLPFYEPSGVLQEGWIGQVLVGTRPVARDTRSIGCMRWQRRKLVASLDQPLTT